MAVDDTDLQATDATTEEADTSTIEEDQATSDLEDTEVSWGDGDDSDDADESEAEAEPEEEAATDSEDDAEVEPAEDVEESEDTDDSDEEAEAEDTPAEEPDEKPKSQAELAREAFKQREQQRLAREAAKAKAQQEYLEGAEDNRDLALRQLQIDAYNNRVSANSDKLTNGIDKAVAAIDLFRTGTPEVKEELAASLDDFERMYVQRDENGDPVAVNGDVYQYLQAKAESIRRLTGIGARQQEKAKNQQKSRTLKTPTKTPQKPKSDPLLDGFDEEASKGW